MMELNEQNSLLVAKLIIAKTQFLIVPILIDRPSFVPLLLPFLHFEPIPSPQRRDSASAS